MQEESRTEELSGVGTKGASSEGFDSQESIIYQRRPAVQRSAVAYRMTLLRGRPRVFSSSDSFGLRFNWVKERYRLKLRCDSPIVSSLLSLLSVWQERILFPVIPPLVSISWSWG